MSKAHKLRNLKLRKVDFVDQGANQFAHIRLAKRNESEAPDNMPESSSEERAFFERLGAFIAKMFHASPVSKEAMTFDQVEESRDTRSTIYRISDSMCESINAIINDKDLDDAQKSEMIRQTADQVADAIKEDIASVFGGTLQKSETTEEHAGSLEVPFTGSDNPDPEPTQQEGETNVIFDTSKMTPEEKATFDDLAKRFGTEDTHDAASEQAAEPHAAPTVDGDIYKGLHPVVQEELRKAREFRDQVETQQLTAVAKKYELLGKKPEELVPLLKSLKAAGGTAYDDMISVLDSNLAAIEKSGVFSEIGKRGTESGAGDNAWGKIEAAAQEIIKSKPGMRWADAVDAACLAHPELVQEYEKSR